MERIFVTSDHHFFHKNIISLCGREFESQEVMHEFMIDAWNSHVTDKDIVYYLGDFCMGKQDASDSIISQLNGKINFIRGNHDRRWFGKTGYHDKVSFLEPIHLLKYQHHRFVLCHYPLVEWEGYFRGRLHLHGHCHGNLPIRVEGSMDVGVDNVGYVPLDIETLLSRLEGEKRSPDGKKDSRIGTWQK